MQTKTIAKVIKAKCEDWLNSITDSQLRHDLEANILVSGGSIASMFFNEPVNDYDIYIKDRSVLMRLVQYYIRPFDRIQILDGTEKEKLVKQLEVSYDFVAEDIKEIDNGYAISLRNLKEDQIKLFFPSGTGGFKVDLEEEADRNALLRLFGKQKSPEPVNVEELPYRPLFFSPNAISLSDDLQIVIRFHGDAEAIHKSFDYIHATNYFTFSDGLVTNKEALESLLTKQLKYQGSLYPVTSIIRAKKFIKRGWNISAGELLKIMFQISQLDLSNPDVLDEQLIGVDVAYFSILIEALRNKQKSDKNFKLTTEYFNTLIDKVFNSTEEEV